MVALFDYRVLTLAIALTSAACIEDGMTWPRIEPGDPATSAPLGADTPTGTATTDPAPTDPDPAPTDPDPAPTDPDPAPTDPDPAPTDPDPAPTDPDPTQTAPDPAASDPDPDPDPTAPDPVPTTARPRVVLLLPGTSIVGAKFASMYQRLVADGFEPVIHEPADLFTGSLAQGAEDVGALVEALKADYGVDTIDIVGQCDGGVVARYYLTLLGGAPNVGRLVTFVAPHHGTELSGVGAWITGWQALEDMRPGSAFLQALNSVPLPAEVHMTSIYSCNDELMVPYTTSVLAGAVNVEFCDHYVKHLGAFEDALVYERIRMSLDGVEGAPTSY